MKQVYIRVSNDDTTWVAEGPATPFERHMNAICIYHDLSVDESPVSVDDFNAMHPSYWCCLSDDLKKIVNDWREGKPLPKRISKPLPALFSSASNIVLFIHIATLATHDKRYIRLGERSQPHILKWAAKRYLPHVDEFEVWMLCNAIRNGDIKA